MASYTITSLAGDFFKDKELFGSQDPYVVFETPGDGEDVVTKVSLRRARLVCKVASHSATGRSGVRRNIISLLERGATRDTCGILLYTFFFRYR
jgi:hypothetical protein